MLEQEEITQNGTEPEGPHVDAGLLDEMTKSGVLYGRRKAKTHPKMHPYIFTTRSGTEILDIVQTVGLIEQAEAFLKGIVQKGGTVLFVGTTPSSRERIKTLAEALGYPYVNERWLGGTITNFKTLNKRLKYYLQLKSDRELGRLEKYTKKERLGFDKEIARLDHLFGGLAKLEMLPQAVFIAGASSHEITVREAKRAGIPIVGILSSDANPADITYPIPANDRARSSVDWILTRFENAIKTAKLEVAAKIPEKNGPAVNGK